MEADLLLRVPEYDCWTELFIAQRRDRSVRLGTQKLGLAVEDGTLHSGDRLHVSEVHQNPQDHERSVREMVRDHQRV